MVGLFEVVRDSEGVPVSDLDSVGVGEKDLVFEALGETVREKLGVAEVEMLPHIQQASAKFAFG